MKRKLELLEAGLRLSYEWLFSVLCSYFIIIIFMGKKPDGFIETALLVIYIASYLVRKNAGYNPGIYASKYYLLYKIDVNKLPVNCKIWVASYGKNDGTVPKDTYRYNENFEKYFTI